MTVDRLNYLRIPGGFGGRAEMVRMVYALANKPYEDVFHTYAEAKAAVEGKSPFRQYPFVETGDGETVYQALAIMHHAAHGTPAWPSDPKALTAALAVAMGGYDLYQAFAVFRPDDALAKEKFEQVKAPKFFGALGEIYSSRSFAAGDSPSFADCVAYEAVAWCVRRNDVCKQLLSDNVALSGFWDRFRTVPAIASFMKRQAAAREQDDSV